MTDVSLAMQGAIVTLLKASAPLAALLGAGTRIHDKVPLAAALPYISIGPAQVTSDDADCIDGAEVFQQVDVWSTEPGFMQCKTIAGQVREILHRAQATGDGLAFEIEHRFTTYLRDGDGLTSHAVLSFRSLIDITGD